MVPVATISFVLMVRRRHHERTLCFRRLFGSSEAEQKTRQFLEVGDLSPWEVHSS